MKRRILSLAALLLIVLSVTAQAAETRMGKTYTLELTWTVNGEEQPPVSVSKRCS